MSKIKELLSQAFSQLDEYNKGGATQHNLLWKAMGNIEDALKELEDVKKSILEIVEKNNLEILKIDLYNDEESFVKFDEYCKFYATLEDVDFEVESIFMYDKVRGMVYCQDKDTKEPVWIVSCGDEGGSWWEVNRVPEFYKNQSKTKE